MFKKKKKKTENRKNHIISMYILPIQKNKYK